MSRCHDDKELLKQRAAAKYLVLNASLQAMPSRRSRNRRRQFTISPAPVLRKASGVDPLGGFGQSTGGGPGRATPRNEAWIAQSLLMREAAIFGRSCCPGVARPGPASASVGLELTSFPLAEVPDAVLPGFSPASPARSFLDAHGLRKAGKTASLAGRVELAP